MRGTKKISRSSTGGWKAEIKNAKRTAKRRSPKTAPIRRTQGRVTNLHLLLKPHGYPATAASSVLCGLSYEKSYHIHGFLSKRDHYDRSQTDATARETGGVKGMGEMEKAARGGAEKYIFLYIHP